MVWPYIHLKNGHPIMIQTLIACLLIQPWIFLPNGAIADQFRLPQGIFMDMVFMAIIAISFIRGNNFLYKNKYLGWLLLWIFFGFAIEFFVPFGLQWKNTGRAVNLSVLEPMLHIFLGVWAMQAILSNTDRYDFVRIAKALCISAVLISSFGIMQFIGWNPWGKIQSGYICSNIISACLDNPNLVGMYCCLTMPLFFMFSDRKYAIGLLITTIGLIISDSHFAIALGLLACILHFVIKYRHIVAVKIASISVIIGSLVVMALNDFTKFGANGMSGRTYVWKFAFDRFKENPIFGSGVGIFKNYGFNWNHTVWFSAHNDWLERAIEIGVVGIILMVLVIANSLKRFTYEGEVNFSYLIMFITFILLMFGSFPLEVPTITMLGLVSFMAVEKL